MLSNELGSNKFHRLQRLLDNSTNLLIFTNVQLEIINVSLHNIPVPHLMSSGHQPLPLRCLHQRSHYPQVSALEPKNSMMSKQCGVLIQSGKYYRYLHGLKTNCGSCYDGHVHFHVYFFYLQIAHLDVLYIRMKGELGFYTY